MTVSARSGVTRRFETVQRTGRQLVHLVSDRPHESRIVLDQQHRLAGTGESAKHSGDSARLLAIEPADRLIEQQHKGIGDERPGEFDEPQRSGGQFAGGDVGNHRSPSRPQTGRRDPARPRVCLVLKACSSPIRCRFSAATMRFSRTVRVWKTLPT